MQISDEIIKLRKENAMTQKAFAKKVGIGEASLQRYESGERIPKEETIKKIAKALEIDEYELLNTSLPVSSNFIRARKKAGLTVEELSERTGIDVERINAIESGIIENPSMYDAKLIGEATGEDSNFLMIPMGVSTLSYNSVKESYENPKPNGGLGLSLAELFPDSTRVIGALEDRIIELFEELNDEGKEKVVEHAELLSKIPEYQKETPHD